MSEALTARAVERVEAAFDMAGVVAQLVLHDAVREGRELDRGDYVSAAMDLVTAAYTLAKLGGPEGVLDYVTLLRSHADTAEQSVTGY
jgi:hypothetical protein